MGSAAQEKKKRGSRPTHRPSLLPHPAWVDTEMVLSILFAPPLPLERLQLQRLSFSFWKIAGPWLIDFLFSKWEEQASRKFFCGYSQPSYRFVSPLFNSPFVLPSLFRPPLSSAFFLLPSPLSQLRAAAGNLIPLNSAERI